MSLARQADRLLGLLSWARVVVSTALVGKLGKIQTSAHHDDEFDHWQSYGFQSRPLAGADAVVVSMGSHADQRVALLVGDRRYTIALDGGEVAVADDLGQKVHLTRTGIVVEAPSIKLGASASLGVARASDPIDMGGATPGSWDAWAALVAAMPGAPPVPTVPPTIASGSAVVVSE